MPWSRVQKGTMPVQQPGERSGGPSARLLHSRHVPAPPAPATQASVPASLHPICTNLQYGIERDFSNRTENVIFYDMGAPVRGASCVCVCVVCMRRE